MECEVVENDINVNITEASSDGNETYDEFLDADFLHLLEYSKWFTRAEFIIDSYVIHYICLFGIIGNLMNLVVLTRKSLSSHMGRLEKSAHVGLIALAVSDLMFCVWTYPHAWMERNKFHSTSIDFWLLYTTYSEGIINSFVLSSSWLTVSMAVCRYLAICHPLRARQYLGMSATRIIIITVFILSILFNLPRFWTEHIVCIEYVGEGRSYYAVNGPMKTNHTAHMAYKWMYFILGIFFPLAILAYCNVFLVKALQISIRLRQEHSSSNQSTNSKRIVTMTLSIIVILYIILVGPAELLTFWQPFIADVGNRFHYSLAVRLCNSLQALNFAGNFILYCIINVHFRKEMSKLLLCQILRGPSQQHRSQNTVSAEMTTQETTYML